MRAGLVQLCSGDDPERNLVTTRDLVRQAAVEGADFVLTPEVTNCVSGSRDRQLEVLRPEEEDATLQALRQEAGSLGLWLLIGSLALRSPGRAAPFVNRSFLIAPDGAIVARYDKIHMFDVTISDTESYRESAGYNPGDRAVLARTPIGEIGMTICYDLRFPHLFSKLARAGARILTVPSAFARPTGEAHWEPLLRARAIECGAFVLAPAQTGEHPTTTDKVRRTHGHSLAVSPWGEVLADGGTDVGLTMVDLDLAQVADCRRRVPSLSHIRPFAGP